MRTNERARARERRVAPDDLCRVPCFKEPLVRRLRERLPDDIAVEEARVLLVALADRSRLRILHALADGEELCVCDVTHVLGMSVSSASHHLRKLRDLRLLTYRNDGKMAYYSVKDRFAAQLATRVLKRARP